MENKLNYPALEQYALKYSDLLAERLFADRRAISGSEILNELPVKQVGLFVLFVLLKKWKFEMEQLKSPYFNYQDTRVKMKLKELMNILSKNILVSKEHFAPLLCTAVEDTLLLTLSPLQYYEELVNSFDGQGPNVDECKELEQFININSHMRDALLNAWASSNIDGNVLDRAFEGLEEAPEDVNDLLKPFNSLLPLAIEEFLLEDNSSELVGDLMADEEEIKVDFETVHAQFSAEKTTILADSLGFEAYNVSLKTMLTINQKFMFIKDLFNGSTEDFNKALDFLDTCESLDVVHKFLNNNYINRGNWKTESPQVKEFMKVLDKRFA